MKDKTVCKICVNGVSYKTDNTSNMPTHLRRKHEIIWSSESFLWTRRNSYVSNESVDFRVPCQLVPFPTRTQFFTNSYPTIYQLVPYCLPTRTFTILPITSAFFYQQILITNSYAIFNINCTCIFVANLMLFINKNLYQLVPSVWPTPP